jgi:hypothetical protein
MSASTDPGTIVEYERHSVSPRDLQHAAGSANVGMDRIIATFGFPGVDDEIEVSTTEQ